MIYSQLPQTRPAPYRTIRKKHVSVIAPGKILLNEKLVLSAMLTGIAMVLITWAVRKGK
jgi:hypothetical protein